MTAQLRRQWVQKSLEETNDDKRFELFAADFCTEFFKTSFLTTSATYDLGADARNPNASSPDLVCATIQNDSSKPGKDVKRILGKREKPSRIVFVYAKPVTEVFMQKVESGLRSTHGISFKLESLSSAQIAQSIERGIGRDAYTRHYAGDYEDIRQAIRGKIDSSPASLSLAFSALTTEDTEVLRQALMDRTILMTLIKLQKATADEIQSSCKEMFGLVHITSATIEHHAKRLQAMDCISLVGGKYSLLPIGSARVESIHEAELRSYADGNAMLRAALEAQLGRTISNLQWEALWEKIRIELTELFRREGILLTNNITSLLQGDNGEASSKIATPPSIAEVIEKISRTCSEPTREQIHEGLKNIFSPVNKDVYEWILHIGSAYVVFCTLGLESSVSQAVRRILSEASFYLDTDVVLSWLCEHEPGHRSAKAIRLFADSCDHPVVVPLSVVEECARHAMRAITDFEFASIGPDEHLAASQILKLFDTVFGREFQFLKTENKVSDEWSDYMRPYLGTICYSAGKRAPDVENFQSLLSEAGFQITPPLDKEDKSLADQIKNLLTKGVAKSNHRLRDDPDAPDKLRIDAEMVVGAHGHMKKSGDPTPAHHILITSASIIKQQRQEILDVANPLPQTLGISEVMWMISLFPSSPISVKEMGAYLFEGKFRESFMGLEKLICRVLDKSKTVKIAPAQQGVLVHRLRTEMLRQAKKYGGDPKAVVRSALDDPGLLSDLVSASIDAEAEILRTPEQKTEIKERLAEIGAQLRRLPSKEKDE